MGNVLLEFLEHDRSVVLARYGTRALAAVAACGVSLAEARAGHAAIVRADGEVLDAGGHGLRSPYSSMRYSPLDTTERFDADTLA